jgi:hypothetical protein
MLLRDLYLYNTQHLCTDLLFFNPQKNKVLLKTQNNFPARGFCFLCDAG